MNILCCGAHPDDIELMAGGTLSRFASEGHKIHCIVFSNGSWLKPDGEIGRDPQVAVAENREIAKALKYELNILDEKTMDIPFEDRLVSVVLREIEKNNIDTLILPWEGDLHKDHQTVARIGISASRRVPRVLHGQINYYLHSFFCPNFFVDISDHYENKINVLKKYKSVWAGKEDDWREFLHATHTYYGKMIGTKMAEGFITNKYLC